MRCAKALVATTNLMRTSADKQVDNGSYSAYPENQYRWFKHRQLLKNGVITTIIMAVKQRGDDHKPPDANTLYEISSITKTSTAALLAYYVNGTKANSKLTDPITKYLPDSRCCEMQYLQRITPERLSNR